MTELIYLTDSYKREETGTVVSVEKAGEVWNVILDRTIFYPQGGGQPSDTGVISGKSGSAAVKHVRLDKTGIVIHECSSAGNLRPGDTVRCLIDWNTRYTHMRVHTAGHIVHQAVMNLYPRLIPEKADHGGYPYIEYAGTLPADTKNAIEYEANRLVAENLPVTAEFVTLAELKNRAQHIPEHLPTNKPLRIVTIGEYPTVPDGGTQVARTGEAGEISITAVENSGQTVRIPYRITEGVTEQTKPAQAGTASITEFIGAVLAAQEQATSAIAASDAPEFEIRTLVFGPKSEFMAITRRIRELPPEARRQAGIIVNGAKQALEKEIASLASLRSPTGKVWFDPTVPGIPPKTGHLHIVTQAIRDITEIFGRIGFSRVRHPEIDWDWYAFEALNMPANHPARDEWETFFIQGQGTRVRGQEGKKKHMVLTPHTSNGQVREMEKKILPIRMINIAKCYRRQSDISHAPMFHQFEGLYADRGVSIAHLKGVIEYFVREFYGPDRVIRLRPFHFRFTEPSFEIDVTCGICLGRGCRLCKEGWLELGGSGMVHPAVLRNGGIDPDEYSGFAFGWGVERTYMMKSGTKLDDIRLLYGNDVRFLEQF